MNKNINIIKIVACAITVVILATAFFVVPDKKLSQKENRTLAQIPKLSAKALFSGEYTSDLADYISDQFPNRDVFVATKAYSELVQGKKENNGIIYGKKSTLIARDDIVENRLQENIAAVKDFQTSTGVSVTLAVLPRTIDVYSERLPKSYPTQDNQTLWENFYTQALSAGVKAPWLYDELCDRDNYYLTDHHYNIDGAYQTYVLLAKSLNYTPYDINYFNRETVSHDFCGTSMRVSGFYLAKKDKIDLLRYNGDAEYTVIADDKQIELYDMSKLETTDKYAVFLGGNHARVDVTSKEDKPNLLVIRDSFADSIAPFLALHYDLIMIDLRYYTESVQQLVCDENIECVLILESMSEFATTKNISYLKLGVTK